MDIGWYRDLVIIILGVVVTCVAIFIAVLSYLLYNKVRSVLNSAEAITATVREITSAVRDEVVNPIIQFVALIRGIFQGVDIVSKFFKKQEGGKDG